ncbi:MAG: hypothetical protein JSU66_17180 [Deltaproteobacteria bacterium]|nr:MAG: hypothetical protein JSU66_17180 [Deltaproteobacteria bacterium]
MRTADPDRHPVRGGRLQQPACQRWGRLHGGSCGGVGAFRGGASRRAAQVLGGPARNPGRAPPAARPSAAQVGEGTGVPVGRPRPPDRNGSCKIPRAYAGRSCRGVACREVALQDRFAGLYREQLEKRGRLTLRAWIDLAAAWRIAQALREHRGNLSAAARSLGIGRRTLYAKMERLGIRPTWSTAADPAAPAGGAGQPEGDAPRPDPKDA